VRMIARRLAKLEATNKKQDRSYVVRMRDGETTKEALARFFEPYGGETWRVAVMPKPCETIEEWHERHASGGADSDANSR
jgi:hypothetical protein